MKYTILSRKNPLDLEALAKFYLQSRMLGTIGLNDICQEISISSSLTRGDVTNTIMCFLDTIPKYLKLGYSVKLDDLGTLRLAINSVGSDTPEEATAVNAKKIHTVFTPSSQLKKEIEATPLDPLPTA